MRSVSIGVESVECRWVCFVLGALEEVFEGLYVFRFF